MKTKKIIFSSLLAVALLFSASSYSASNRPSKCDDYDRAKKENCGRPAGWAQGSTGSCTGAIIGSWIAGC